MTKLFDCVCVGLTTVDAIALLPQTPGEDEKIRAERIIIDGGGPAGTCACVLGKYGLKTGLFSFIGQDPLTGFVMESLTRHNVSTRFIRKIPGLRNPFSMIFVNRLNASRTIIWNAQGTTLRKIPLSSAIKKGVLSAKSLHFDGHLMDLSIKLAGAARKRGILTSYDCGSARKGWEKLAALTDIFIASHKFTAELGLQIPEAVLLLRKKFGFKTAVTAGEKGVWYFDEAAGEARRLRQKKYPAVDTTGCGDVFHGAFLSRYLLRRNFKDALEFAQKTAGKKTLRPGGRNGIPRTAIDFCMFKNFK